MAFDLEAMLRALRDVEFILVGGVAAAVQGAPIVLFVDEPRGRSSAQSWFVSSTDDGPPGGAGGASFPHEKSVRLRTMGSIRQRAPGRGAAASASARGA
jgi:hypothetical protein